MTPRRSTTDEPGRLDAGQEHDPRSLEQEVAEGKTPEAPVAVFASVIGAVAVLFVLALVLAVVAYLLA